MRRPSLFYTGLLGMVMTITTCEALRAVYISFVYVSGQWATSCVQDAVCTSIPMLHMARVCADAAAVCAVGYTWSVLQHAAHEMRWCLGFSCADALRDAWSALALGAFAIIMYVIKSGSAQRAIGRWWRERPERAARGFEQKMLRRKMLEDGEAHT